MEFLSSAQNTNVQQANIDLAKMLAESKDANLIREIAENLHNKDKAVAGDCIKVLYELGKLKPELIAGYIADYLELLSSKNNRMVWGAMYAIAQSAPYRIKEVNDNFNMIIKAYETGSVITIDSAIVVFANVAKASVPNSKKAFDIIIKHLKTCRPKEIPQHSKKAFLCINSENCDEFESVLTERYSELSASQKKRVDKVLAKIEKKEFK
ncbi:MAG: hypothetical protein JXN65_01880 [Clostridia bacterium]|nr:hypothetical protein [Clostridia bacterium]